MDTFWKDNYANLIDKVVVKTDLNEKQVIEILDSYFYGIKTFLAYPSVPIVKTRFFNFKPNKDYLKKTIKLFKIGKIDKENLKSKFDRYWKVLDRLKEEARGSISHFLWTRIEKKSLKNKEVPLSEIYSKSIKKGKR